MSHRKQKAPTGGPSAGENGTEKNQVERLQFNPDSPECQPFKPSPDSLTRIAYLAGDLAMFYLRQCQGFISLPDPEFNAPFSKACELLTIEDQLLRRAAAELLEAGQ